MTLHHTLTTHIQKAVEELFNISIEKVEFQATRKEFEGDITMVVFPLVKVLKGKPAANFKAYVGCAKWNKADLKNFYPRGTKDELGYYSSQFNKKQRSIWFCSSKRRRESGNGRIFFTKYQQTITFRSHQK